MRPHRRQPTRLPVPGILQARTLEWVAISFSNAWKWKVKVKSLSRIQLLATPWTAAYQAPPSMGFSRQEYWSGLPLPSLHHLGLELLKMWESFIPRTSAYTSLHFIGLNCIMWPFLNQVCHQASQTSSHQSKSTYRVGGESVLPGGFPGFVVKSLPALKRHRRHRFNPWVGKIPWRSKWQLTPVFLLGKFHRQRSLVAYSPMGSQRFGHDWTCTHLFSPIWNA